MASSSKSGNDFTTNWEIEKYRADYESEEHWELRKRFMKYHKEQFPEERLVCLAQVFINIEFLGCKYPEETMHLVSNLSHDVAKEFRESRSSRLKRTFVAASEAAEQRVKGRRNAQQQQQEQRERQGTISKISTSRSNGEFKKRFQSDMEIEENNKQHSSSKRMRHENFFRGLPYGQFVIHLIGGRNCLSLSAQRSKVSYEERVTCVKKVEILINGKVIACAEESNLKASKTEAFQKSLSILQKQCYSIKPNPMQDTIKIDKKDKQIVCDIIKQPIDEAAGTKLDASNKGYKMMRMMGWSGGGLGVNMQGREDPVNYLLKNNRSGLGNSTNLDKQYFRDMLKNYIESEDIRQLQFEPSFQKDERACLHEIAANLNLKSVARGIGEKRYLTISKKTISDEKILTEILINKNPRYCDKYFVQVPESKSEIYIDHTQNLVLD